MDTKKLAIAACAAGVALYAVFLLTRESPDEKFDRLRAERNTPGKPEFSADNAYVLHVDFTSGVVADSQSAIRDALLAQLQKSLAPIGLNPDSGRQAGGGELGTITASVAAACQGYQGSSAAALGSIPKAIELDLTVQSAGGSSSWDGTTTASASIVPPTSVADAGFYVTQRKLVSKLVKKLVAQIDEKKRFERSR